MKNAYLEMNRSPQLSGSVSLIGAKNSVLVAMISLILTRGVSRLYNVPASADVLCMIHLLEELGATVHFSPFEHILEVDTREVSKITVHAEIMKKMRASVLVMGPLLARFGKAYIALPGGDVIGMRPIDYHIKNFIRMGVTISQDGDYLCAQSNGLLRATKHVLEYPSVGATENTLLAAVLTKGTTRIINAALEPEVLDLIDILCKMGARIAVLPPAMLEIEGVHELYPIEHTIIPDRLEAGALLCAAAITGGSVTIPDARVDHLDSILEKLHEMGHEITVDDQGRGVTLKATKTPRAVSIKTGPFPAFPTDLQAPMMALQCVANGVSVIEETVYENRFLHVHELRKMGASTSIKNTQATITGVEALYGAQVIATDIRASVALVLAGLAAHGTTIMTGVHHWKRGYDAFDLKLAHLGASITCHEFDEAVHIVSAPSEKDTQRERVS